jgi:ribosomal protein S18 acetylase RimI-like enzyme
MIDPVTDDVVVRLATQGDAESLVDFNCSMAMETESKALVPEVVASGVNGLLSNRGLGFYLVAESGGAVAGSLMVTTEWSDWRNGVFWWIQSVYVLPKHRRQGIYRRLYEHVKALAAGDQKVCGFRLYVEKENRAAQKTYASLGMTETDYRMYEEPNGNGERSPA